MFGIRIGLGLNKVIAEVSAELCELLPVGLALLQTSLHVIAESIQSRLLDGLCDEPVIRIVRLRDQQFHRLIAFGNTDLLFADCRINCCVGQALVRIRTHRDRDSI